MKTTKYILTLITVMIMTVGDAWGAITPTTPSKDASGVYQIGTAGELWGFAQGVNNGTIAATSNAKLTADIDLGGSANGSFPGIGVGTSTPYKGVFDGQGHSITNFYQLTSTVARTGFFNYIQGTNNTTGRAIVKNFKISGEKDYPSTSGQAMHGTVVGEVAGYALLEDVESSVTFKSQKAFAMQGGIAGCVNANGVINRCTYSGSIKESLAIDRVGGIVGEMRGGTISNCLFIGEIINTSNSTSLCVGGIAGATGTTDGSKIKNCFSHGTITLKNNTSSKTGYILGNIAKTITISDTYYTTTNVTGITKAVGTGSGSAEEVTNSSDLTDGTLLSKLKANSGEWVAGASYPVPGKKTSFTISFYIEGQLYDSQNYAVGASVYAPTAPTKDRYTFDGWYDSDNQVVTFPFAMPEKDLRVDAQFSYAPNGDGVYEIGNKEDFFNFADVVNGNSTKGISANYAASAKLIDNVDLENTEFAGFGQNATDKFYTGTFDGQGHTIRNFTRTCTTSNGCGFFNAINNATVKDFTLEGNITFNFSNEQYYNSSVVAYMTGTSKIEDVHSKVNATMTNGKTRLYGGILGRGSGIVNRCRYSGTVSASTSYDQIAGICASANVLTISNCLFDGSITSESTNANLCIGGIVAKTNQNGNTLSNNLVNGTISPSTNTYAYCGVVIGNASNTISMDRCYYVGVGSLPAVGTPTKSTGTATLVDPSADGFKWLDICVALNAGSSNWGIGETEGYPVPGASAPATYTLSFEMDGGTPEIASQSLPLEATVSEPSPAPTKTGYTFAGWYKGDDKVTFPMTMPASDVTLTAHWNINQYTLTFDVKGGTSIDPIEKDYNTEITLPTAVKTGYSFDEWNTEADGTGTSYAAGVIYTITADATLHAQYTYVPNAQGVFEIATQEDLFNFATYVNRNDLGQDNGRGSVDAKLIADITLDGTPFPGIGQYKTKVTDDKTKKSYYHYTSEGKWVDVTGGTLNGDNYTFKDKTTVKTYAGDATGAIGEKPTNPEADKVYCVTDYVPYLDESYAYTGTFDGQGFSITNYLRTVPTGNYGGFFNYVKDATITNFSIAGTMSVAGTAQQYGSVVGCSAGNTLVEDVYSSVDVTISSTAAQVGGFVGRAGGTYNRCRYDGTISSETAYNKIGGFAGNITACTLTNCLFDGSITLSANNAALMTAGLVASSFGDNPHVIKNCLVNGTMTISHPTDSCGIVVGYYEQALTVDRTYYTGSDRAITGAKGTLTGQATPVGSLTMVQLRDALNPTEGTDGNWEIKAEQQYPVPSKCTKAEHVHEYINGFCIAGDSYEEATKAQDGWYEIANAGQLWWMAKRLDRVTVNGSDTLALKTRIRLTNNINMDGETHGQFPGICPLGNKQVEGQVQLVDDWEGTAFQGIFDGKGHTISNYGRTISAGLTRRGLFNAVYNATIRNLNIDGSLTITGNGSEAVMIGAVIGDAAGTSLIEDINSSVNITVNNGVVRDLGGVAGALDDLQSKAITTMNRCRYNGTITLKGTQNKAVKNVGGLVGELRSALMKNCLYDGTITVETGVAYESVGGVVGKVGTRDNSEMHRILSHGKITLPTGYVEATNKCGIVVGSADKTIYLSSNPQPNDQVEKKHSQLTIPCVSANFIQESFYVAYIFPLPHDAT